MNTTGTFIVENALNDHRFADNTLVTGAPWKIGPVNGWIPKPSLLSSLRTRELSGSPYLAG
jgi:hypothetical protein